MNIPRTSSSFPNKITPAKVGGPLKLEASSPTPQRESFVSMHLDGADLGGYSPGFHAAATLMGQGSDITFVMEKPSRNLTSASPAEEHGASEPASNSTYIPSNSWGAAPDSVSKKNLEDALATIPVITLDGYILNI